MTDIETHTQDLTEGMTWRDCLQVAMAPGRGTVITTGHFGSWDLAGAIVARQVPLSAVADTFKDARINSLLQGHRRDKRVDIIPTSNAARLTMRDLSANRAVAIVADRPVAEGRGVEVTFFGHNTFVPAGSATLAFRSGAPVMPGFVWYRPDGYSIRAFPPMFPRTASNARDRALEIQRLTQYMFACQEQVVGQFPTQWFMFRRFWPTAAQISAGQRVELRAA